MLMVFYQKETTFFKRKEKSPPLEIQAQFFKRLYQLLNNGYSLINSLQLIQLERNLTTVSLPLKSRLINGSSLGYSLQDLGFHPLMSSFLITVESTGNLKRHISTCIKIAEQQINYVEKLKRIIRYPLILSIFFIILFIIINNIVLPSFETIIPADNETSFSLYSVINIIKIIGLIIIFLLCSIAFMYFMRNKLNTLLSIKQKIEFLQRIPFINYLITLHTTFLFSAQLSTLLNSGMTFKNTLHHLSQQSQMPIISYYSDLLIKEFRKGGDIVDLLYKLPLIDEQLALLFQNNTNVKQLAKDLTMYEQILFDEFENSIIKSIQLIQPVFFTVLALFIVLMYISILWPMFDLINNL